MSRKSEPGGIPSSTADVENPLDPRYYEPTWREFVRFLGWTAVVLIGVGLFAVVLEYMGL